MQTKMRMQQLQSVLDDEPAVRALSNGNLDEVDEYQFALCSYFLGQYDKVVATTLRLIRENPSYAAPYVLQGLAYTAEKKYPEAQQSFLPCFRFFPTIKPPWRVWRAPIILAAIVSGRWRCSMRRRNFPFLPPRGSDSRR